MKANTLAAIRKMILLLVVLACHPAIPGAQPRLPLQRLGYRDLGYLHFSQIPADGSYITSLTATPDGQVYGATSGFRSYLFVFSPKTDQVKPLGYLPGCEGVHHSMAAGRDGSLFLGGGQNVIQPFPIARRSGGGLNWVSEDLWQQVENRYRGYAGGHLYRYEPAPPGQAWQGDKPAKVEDLGIPVPGDGIYCLAMDPEREVLYGISYPHGHFFLYEAKNKAIKDLGTIFREILFGGPDIRTLRSLPRNLAVDRNGCVYASGDEGRILRYCPQTQQVQTLEAAIPGTGIRVIEAWVVSGEVIYGGTSDGYLFRFHPASQNLENLGKPLVEPRIRGLTLGRNGDLFGLGGERFGVNTFFRYDPASSTFEIMGSIEVDRSPYYARRAHQFDAMATAADGTIFMGESDRGGHLFFFIP